MSSHGRRASQGFFFQKPSNTGGRLDTRLLRRTRMENNSQRLNNISKVLVLSTVQYCPPF
jgi:hypothetical protein